MSEAVTGIEFVCGIPDITKRMIAVFHTLHLDKVTEVLANNTHLLISIDGAVQELPVKEAHVVPCAAGDHDVTCALKSWGLTDALANWNARTFAQTQKIVRVEPGQIVTVRYLAHATIRPGALGPNTNADLEILGTRAG